MMQGMVNHHHQCVRWPDMAVTLNHPQWNTADQKTDPDTFLP